MKVTLSNPIARVGGAIATLEVRAPGRRVVDAMTAERVPGGFTDVTVVKFGARLSGVAEQHIRKMSERDLQALRQALEAHYARERRRYAARQAILANDKDRKGAATVREVLDGRR